MQKLINFTYSIQHEFDFFNTLHAFKIVRKFFKVFEEHPLAGYCEWKWNATNMLERREMFITPAKIMYLYWQEGWLVIRRSSLWPHISAQETDTRVCTRDPDTLISQVTCMHGVFFNYLYAMNLLDKKCYKAQISSTLNCSITFHLEYFLHFFPACKKGRSLTVLYYACTDYPCIFYFSDGT